MILICFLISFVCKKPPVSGGHSLSFLVDSNFTETVNMSSVDLQIISSISTTPAFRNEAFLRRLYEVEKLPARQIAVLIGCRHSTINEALKRYGILRQVRRGGQCPYGYRRYMGKLIPLSAQQRVLKKMYLLQESGWSANRIAGWLNTSKIKTPTRKGHWYQGNVSRILNRKLQGINF